MFFRETLCAEREYLYVFLAPVDLLKLAGTCRYFNVEVRQYISKRLRFSLVDFVDDPISFLGVMEVTRTVISGSFAFQFIFGERSAVWSVNDLDLYTTKEGFEGLKEELEIQGYVVQHQSQANDSPYVFSKILKIVKMKKGENVIDVIVSQTNSSIQPIFQFHSSIVMNYVSASTIFSAYGHTAARYKSFANPMLFFHQRVTWRTLMSYKKYQERGVEMHSPSVLWMQGYTPGAKPHKCTRYLQCPCSVRKNVDSGCLLASLDACHPFRRSAEQAAVEKEIVVWVLSNDRCDGKHLYTSRTPEVQLLK
ncbi:hypothetical protein EV363DRAFT_1187818 [Boletus edulis]|nr:hypothetical protein EV363DRAFT_1187818 [Boletus edulis]